MLVKGGPGIACYMDCDVTPGEMVDDTLESITLMNEVM